MRSLVFEVVVFRLAPAGNHRRVAEPEILQRVLARVRKAYVEAKRVPHQVRKRSQQVVVDVRHLHAFALRLERDRARALEAIFVRLEVGSLARPRHHVAAAEPDVAVAAGDGQQRELGVALLRLSCGPLLRRLAFGCDALRTRADTPGRRGRGESARSEATLHRAAQGTRSGFGSGSGSGSGSGGFGAGSSGPGIGFGGMGTGNGIGWTRKCRI